MIRKQCGSRVLDVRVRGGRSAPCRQLSPQRCASAGELGLRIGIGASPAANGMSSFVHVFFAAVAIVEYACRTFVSAGTVGSAVLEK